MNYITTNIRFREDVYMELKIEAAKKRTSVAALVRESVEEKIRPKNKDTENFMARLNKFARKISSKYPNLRLSEKLIEMRYEQ